MLKIKKWRKSLILLSFLLIAAILGGCGKTATTGDGITTIHWYMLKPIDNLKDQQIIEDEANKIFNKEIKANLKFHFIDSGTWNDKMNVMISAGEAYDICFTSGWSNSFLTNAQRGAFLDIKGLLDKYGQDILKKNDPRVWSAVTVKGQVLAIPGQGQFVHKTAYVFKKELVDKYNFDYKSVKSVSDLEPYFKILKEKEPDIVPMAATGSNKPLKNYSEVSVPSGIYYNEQDGKFVSYLDIPEKIDEYKELNRFYKLGYIPKSAASKGASMADLKTGKYAVMNDTGAYTEDGSKSSAAYGFPCVESLQGTSRAATAHMISAMSAISKTSKNPEKSMQLLNLIWKDRYLSNTLAYGIKGIHYTVKSGEGTENISILPKTGKEQTWAVWHNWLGPLWDQWDSTWNSTESLRLMKEENDTAEISNILGFILDTEPVKAEVAQISSIITEANPIITTGSMDDFEKYIGGVKKKLEDAGMQKVLDEATKQLEEWKSTK